MNRWWRNVVKDYLTFSKRERTGLSVLIILGVVIYFLPVFFKPKKAEIKNSSELQKDLAHLKITVDTAHGYNTRAYNNYGNEDNGEDYLEPKNYNDYAVKPKGELFEFDPNTIDAAGWKRLGVRDKTINTIQKFTSKGFKFRKPEDLLRIYGLRPEEANRLIPYVRIAATNGEANSFNNKSSNPNYPTKVSVPYKPRMIDINEADTSAFISLPGIGSKLAFRIVNFRDKLGGFYSVDQIAETYGVPDSTFQKIKPRLQCNNPSIKKININEADINTLKSHPYIKYNIGNAIINYRKQHGNFKSIDDLHKIDIINDEVFKKIAPYLVV